MKQRQDLILKYLEDQGAAEYQDLANLLGVSTMTVRRDINELARQGAVIKTLGGVQKVTAPVYYYETNLLSRLAIHIPEKRALAHAAVALIQPQETIFLDPSTTCLELAKVVARECHEVTIITNSALACIELGRGHHNTIIGIGGQYHSGSASFTGPSSEEEAGKFFVNRAFISTKGFLPAEGTFESVIATFRIKQTIARQCEELILLVDHSKFGQRALCKVLNVEQIQTIVTDAQAPEAELRRLEASGKRVLIARVPEVLALDGSHGT